MHGSARQNVPMAKGATPAIVMLEAAGVAFTVTEFHHEPGEGNYGQVAAEALGIESERVLLKLRSVATGHLPKKRQRRLGHLLDFA